jgi:hypothetical protein
MNEGFDRREDTAILPSFGTYKQSVPAALDRRDDGVLAALDRRDDGVLAALDRRDDDG